MRGHMDYSLEADRPKQLQFGESMYIFSAFHKSPNVSGISLAQLW